MANIVRVVPFWSISKAGSNTVIVGDGHFADVSALSIQIVDTSSLSASITVKARTRQPAADTNSVAFVPTVYRKLYLNGAVGDGTLVSTAITGNSLIIVPATGLDVALDITYTSGEGMVYVTALRGSSVI